MIVVEGYMDAIALANAGIREAVAPLGTALTENQIELLWRQVERPILCFDGDKAGQRAAMRAISRALPMLRPAHSLAIVRLPTGMDPDDVIRDQGVGAIEQLLAEPASLLDTLWDFEKAAAPLNSPEDKAGLKARLLDARETAAHAEQAAERKSMVGSGDRSERIRTYNFPQGRLTDHRINLTLYRLNEIIAGDLDEVIGALLSEHQAGQLAALADGQG